MKLNFRVSVHFSHPKYMSHMCTLPVSPFINALNWLYDVNILLQIEAYGIILEGPICYRCWTRDNVCCGMSLACKVIFLWTM